MRNKITKVYSLDDISRQINYIPILFIVVLAFVAVIITSLILENKLNTKIELLKEKESFYKNDLLKSYVDSIEYSIDVIFNEKEQLLKSSLSEVMGYIKAVEDRKDIDIEDIRAFIRTIEEEHNISFVLYNNKTFKIHYGKRIIPYFRNLIKTNIREEIFQKQMLLNLEYMGKNNIQYWKEKETNNIRLSYFNSLVSSDWSLGFFSNIKDLKTEIKKTIFETILPKSKGIDGYFWFYDYSKDIIFNYNNKAKAYSSTKLKRMKTLNLSNFDINIKNKSTIFLDKKGIHNFLKYNFLLAVEIDYFTSNLKKLKKEFYDQIILYTLAIIFISFFLIILNLAFVKIITRVFSRFNYRLELKSKQYKIWKERYELAIIASNDGLWDIDFENNKIYFSSKWLQMFSYKRGEIDSFTKWFSLIHEDDQKRVKRIFDEHLNGLSTHFVCEYRIKNSKNKFQWVLARGKAFYKENILDRMVMMSMDINERKNLSKELQYVETLVDSGSIVFFKCRNDSRLSISTVSNSINFFGYKKNELENKNVSFFDIVYSEDIEKIRAKINNSITNFSDSFEATYRIVTKEGELKWVFNKAILVKDHSGIITHFYGYINDITKMKLTQTQLQDKVHKEVAKNIEKDRLLVHQNKLASMGEMLGSIAHQWRQPLNNINLLVHFVRDNYENPFYKKEDLHESISSVKLQIDYMSKTIDDFRNFYQPNKDKTNFSLEKSITNAYKIVENQFVLNNIVLNIASSSIKINNYENEFQQVIVNILNNACDACIVKQKNEVFEARVDISIFEKDKRIYIEIVNNGGKIEEDLLHKMFEPYFTTKFEKQGTGIGLYMSKTIIEKNMKGLIYAKNTKNGIKFIITLPF